MCMGAILCCGMGRLVFAASTAQRAAKIDQIMLTSVLEPLHHLTRGRWYFGGGPTNAG